MSKILLFHGGGPTAVINASLAGAISALQGKGLSDSIYFSPYGIAKMLTESERKIPHLSDDALDRLARSPGSAIGSGRDHLEDEDYAKIASILKDRGFTAVIGTGGNGTMDTVRKLASCCGPLGIAVTGIPKTMDNDLSITDHSPGFLSAANYMAGSVREVLYDIHSLPIHIVVIESLGRNAGWIAASSALAGSEDMPGPDMILIPEVPFDKERFLSRADELYRKKGGVSVVASEGLSYSDGTPIVDPVFTVGRSVYFGDVSSKLSQLITRELGIKSRSEKPGLLSRASIAWQSGRDREEAFACGYASASAALEGRSSVMSIIERTGSSPYSSRIAIRGIEDTILEERCLDEDMYDRDSFTVTDSFRSYLEPMMDSRGARFTAFA